LIFNASGVVPFIIELPRTLPWLLDFDAYSVVHPEILELHNKCTKSSPPKEGLISVTGLILIYLKYYFY